MSETWNHSLTQMLNLAPFRDLEQVFGLAVLETWPDAGGLNQLNAKLGSPLEKRFIDQSDVADDWGYYEEIIFQRGGIPTRSQNWHDLFNGLIWLLFPQTKSLLNAQHMQDIAEHGLSPRTRRRNRITHFDECGLILAHTDNDVIAMLQQHQWEAALLTRREKWGREIEAFCFGHANLEMLLAPFNGLTGKWLAMEVEPDFADLSFVEQCALLDEQVCEHIRQCNLFDQMRPLRPLPLLGIPGWHDEALQTREFYQDSGQFRPLRDKSTGQ